MTNSEILENLNDYNFQWRVQDCNRQSILFYNLKEGQEDEFLKRIHSCPARWIYVAKGDYGFLPSKVIQIDHWLPYQKELLNKRYPIKREKLQFIGITGTNGKTSTAMYIKDLFSANNVAAMSIGTLGAWGAKKYFDYGQTTPSLMDLHKTIFEFQDRYQIFSIELSSHALDQQRFYGEELDAAIWTNFSQDHLDYHQTMEHYFNAKKKIFNYLKKNAKLYILDKHHSLIKRIDFEERLQIVQDGLIEGPILSFMKDNYLLAAALIKDQGLVADWKMISEVPGRANVFMKNSSPIVVDFAHTPDALENLLAGIRERYPDYKMKVVFGCGGDRDKGKRPLMAQAVACYADFSYITNDNPRSEKPEEIAKDIEKGFLAKNYQVILDREKCVQQAIADLSSNEVLVIAGKGHETGIQIGNRKIPYSDLEVVRKILS